MYCHLVKTALSGYDGPIIAPLARANSIFATLLPNIDGSFMQAAGNMTINHIKSCAAQTEDGYSWWRAHHFRLRAGEMAILFPRSYGSGLDRSIAIYTKGNAEWGEVVKTLKNFLLALISETFDADAQKAREDLNKRTSTMTP